MARLLACPVNDPAPDGDLVHRFALFAPLARERDAAHRALDVPASSRIAFVAFAPWAIRAAHGLGRSGHYPAVLGRLTDALVAAGEEVTLVVVSPSASPATRRGPVHARFVPYLERRAYETLLLGADLVVTDNAIQFSAAKAFVAGIPTLVLVNSDAALSRATTSFRSARGCRPARTARRSDPSSSAMRAR